MNDLIEKTLGQYEIKEQIGQGGMARVFKAYQPGLDRFVAVKVLSPSLAEEAGFTERFQREAHSVARLHHPHILEVYDFGVQDSYNYLVMRYVENSLTLGDLIRDGAPLGRLINYLLQVADALNYAHERGVIHRDVKPSNILIDGKWALLGDFGLAKVREASSHLTGTGVGMGTPAYMSPEQASGAGVVDHRTDIYALGVILYRILAGTVPHDAPTPFAMLARRCSEPAPSLRQTDPNIPEDLDRVVLRSLVMEPNGRYSTAAHFAEALEKVRKDLDIREKKSATIPVIQGETAMVGELVAGEAATRISEGKMPSRTAVVVRRKNVGLIVGGAIAAVVGVGVLLFVLLSLLVGSGGFFVKPAAQAMTPDSAESSAAASEVGVLTSPTDTPTPIPPGTPSATAKTDLEVRSGPGDEYELLGYLPVGAEAQIVGRDKAGQWWKIKTSLNATGGWIEAGSDFSEAADTNNVPIALAPPTPTPVPVADTPTSTATPVPKPPTPTATSIPDTPTPTFTRTQPPPSATPTVPAATKAPTVPALPAGQFTLLKPISLDEPTYGMTEFEWQWGSPLAENQGFEVRVWREGEPPAGVHDAVEDNKSGKVVALGNNTYHLGVDIRDAAGVRGRSGEYLWTIVLVQISPDYKDLGKQATPGRLRFEAGGDGGDKGGGDGGLNP
jgi:serine/threonine protein kinase/uncharacterized protein YraI